MLPKSTIGMDNPAAWLIACAQKKTAFEQAVLR